jgi:hypothetical protein
MTHEDPNRAEGVDHIADRAQEAIDTVRDQAQGVTGSLKGLVREGGKKLKGTADVLERAGDYLEKQDFQDVRPALERRLRRRPIQALLVTLGAAYVLARGMRR